MDVSAIVVLVVVTALVFDVTNGFHGRGGPVGPGGAQDLRRPRHDTRITPVVISAGLVGAIVWNLTTWLLGLPSRSGIDAASRRRPVGPGTVTQLLSPPDRIAA